MPEKLNLSILCYTYMYIYQTARMLLGPFETVWRTLIILPGLEPDLNLLWVDSLKNEAASAFV